MLSAVMPMGDPRRDRGDRAFFLALACSCLLPLAYAAALLLMLMRSPS